MKDTKKFGFVSNFKGIETVALVPEMLDGIHANQILNHQAEIEERLLYSNPIIATRIRGQTETGDDVDGLFAFTTLTANQMLNLPLEIVMTKIKQAVLALANSGCEVIGLGSLTGSALTGNGKRLMKWATEQDILLTSGNAFAAVGTVMTVEKIISQLGLQPRNLTIGILGATGSIGWGVSQDIAIKLGPSHLKLVSKTIGKLEELDDKVRSYCSTSISTQINDLCDVDLLIVTTADAGSLVSREMPKSGMIIVDETQPSNVGPEFLSRKDVLVVDGAFISTPRIDYGMNMDCPAGMIYACMAQTMMLSLYGIDDHFDLGRVDYGLFPEVRNMAERYGMGLAPLHSFSKPITKERLDEFALVCVS